jgi:adsorption protein B
MTYADILIRFAAELALFAGIGFLLFAANDLAVDLIYFIRRLWRSATVYRRFPRAFASGFPKSPKAGLMAVFVPAWDESAVIA